MESSATPGITVYPDSPALAPDKLSSNIKAQPKSRIAIVPIVLNTKELLKDLLLRLFGNANPEIFYANGHVLIIGRRTDNNLIRIRRIFDGVGKNIGDDLACPFPVGQD